MSLIGVISNSKAWDHILELTTDKIQKDIERDTPVRTGRLKRSIRRFILFDGKRKKFQIRIGGVKAPYVNKVREHNDFIARNITPEKVGPTVKQAVRLYEHELKKDIIDEVQRMFK